MLNYWLCVTNKENWDIIKKLGIWGVSKASKRQIERVHVSDNLVFYVTPQTIGGIFTAVSESFESDEIIFRWGEFGRYEIFAYRVKLEPIILPKDLIKFNKDLAEKLTFVTYKQKWSVHLKRAMRLISEEDYEILLNALQGDEHRSANVILNNLDFNNLQ